MDSFLKLAEDTKLNFQFSIFNFQLSKKLGNASGYTILELLLVLAVFSVLLGFATTNLSGAQQTTSVTSTTTTLVSDIANQQSKAMDGATEGRSATDSYGIHFDSNKYELFHGTSYSSSDSTNLVISLDKNMIFTNITFPSSQIVFTKGTGEVMGFQNGANTVTVKNSVGTLQQKTITINRLGAVVSVQ